MNLFYFIVFPSFCIFRWNRLSYSEKILKLIFYFWLFGAVQKCSFLNIFGDFKLLSFIWVRKIFRYNTSPLYNQGGVHNNSVLYNFHDFLFGILWYFSNSKDFPRKINYNLRDDFLCISFLFLTYQVWLFIKAELIFHFKSAAK